MIEFDTIKFAKKWINQVALYLCAPLFYYCHSTLANGPLSIAIRWYESMDNRDAYKGIKSDYVRLSKVVNDFLFFYIHTFIYISYIIM